MMPAIAILALLHAHTWAMVPGCTDLLDEERVRHARELAALQRRYEAKLAAQAQEINALRAGCAYPNAATPSDGPAPASVRSHGGARRLHQQSVEVGGEPSCSSGEIKQVLGSASDPAQLTNIVAGFFETNLPCAMCPVQCSGTPMPDVLLCAFGCMSQSGNRCDNSTGVDRITSMLPRAALDDRESILRLLERVEADCAYCLLETIESVCGAGCVHQHLHIVSDYPILARRCLPEFAAALASAQARVARQAMGSAAPIGMSVGAELGATDLFVSTGERVHNSFVYRGVHGGEWLYRCAQDDLELWSLSRSDDREAWSRCEGRLWVELETAQARTHATDPSAAAGGVLFGVGMERCGRVLATEATRAAILQAPRAGDDAGPLSFADGASALEVACTLLWMLGSYGSRQSGRTTLELPSHVGAIELIGDIVVHNGEDVRLTGAQQGTELHVGGRQLRIDRGGALELDHLVLTASIGSSAVFALGVLAISNCTLSDAVAGATVILRYMESLVPAGSLAQPPVHGAAFASTGGALLHWFRSSAVTAINVRFQNNTARPTGVLHDGRSLAGGGAIGGLGGDLELEAVTVEGCVAIGGFTGWGGAILGMFTRLRISSSTFRANEVVPYRSPSVDATLPGGTQATLQGEVWTYGGVVYSLRSEVTIDSSVFENNAAANGGALFVNEGSSISLIASILHGNAARDGTMCAGGKASIMTLGIR